MTEIREKRYLKLEIDNKDFSCRIKTDETTGKRYLIGYGSVFNVKSKIITEYIDSVGERRTFFEVIDPKAFDSVDLSSANDIVLSVNHRNDNILGKTISGTLKLFIDEKGLRYECEIPNTTLGNDCAVMVERGDYFESSFIFTVSPDGQTWVRDNNTNIWIRTITKADNIYDVTLCTYRGAYSETDISVASRIFKENVREDDIENHEDSCTDKDIDFTSQDIELEIFILENN